MDVIWILGTYLPIKCARVKKPAINSLYSQDLISLRVSCGIIAL